jgi:UDP-N-acetylglucosamine 2-epimerase (non-hydrolysing)
MKIFFVAGARPNFMKIAPLVHELERNSGGSVWKIIHTGQHYDYEMSKTFFDDFELPSPHYFLNVGSGSHANQTAKIMISFEDVCLKERPDIVVVVGDVNSTLACSITAKKIGIQVAHVEAGLRSGDMSMPEEINRIVTDSISDYLFVTEKSGAKNLKREGKRKDQIHFVGNIMIDTLHYGLDKLKKMSFEEIHKFKVQMTKDAPYAVVTLHRPSNVDDPLKLRDILESLVIISRDMPIVFPMHPRTNQNMKKFALDGLLEKTNIHVGPPLSYLKFLSLWRDSAIVLTDSGGIQEETTALDIPCFTLRDNTERPITIEEGTNVLVGTTSKKIISAYEKFKKGEKKKGKIPELWDGNASIRIIRKLLLQ